MQENEQRIAENRERMEKRSQQEKYQAKKQKLDKKQVPREGATGAAASSSDHAAASSSAQGMFLGPLQQTCRPWLASHA